VSSTVHTLPGHDLMTFFMGAAAQQATHNLSPSFGEPLTVAELLGYEPGATEALSALALDYTGVDGSTALRTAISGQMPGLTADGIVVTSGADEAIALLLMALVEAGSRVVVQTPAYLPLRSVAAWRGAQIFDLPCREQSGWAIDLDQFDALCQRGCRVAILNAPHNPTGYTPSATEISAILEILDRTGGWLIVDEVYAGMPPAERDWTPYASRHPRCITLNGLSKSYGLPGLRVGWIASQDREAIGLVKRLRQHFNSFTAGPSQFLAEIAVKHGPAIHQRNWEIAATGRAALQAFMTRHAQNFSWHPPQAGVNAFVRWQGPGGTKHLSERLLADAKLLLAPSAYFGAGDDHVRIGFGKRDLAEGLDRLSDWLVKEKHR